MTTRQINLRLTEEDYKILEELQKLWYLDNNSATLKRALRICHNAEMAKIEMEKRKDGLWNDVK